MKNVSFFRCMKWKFITFSEKKQSSKNGPCLVLWCGGGGTLLIKVNKNISQNYCLFICSSSKIVSSFFRTTSKFHVLHCSVASSSAELLPLILLLLLLLLPGSYWLFQRFYIHFPFRSAVCFVVLRHTINIFLSFSSCSSLPIHFPLYVLLIFFSLLESKTRATSVVIFSAYGWFFSF